MISKLVLALVTLFITVNAYNITEQLEYDKIVTDYRKFVGNLSAKLAFNMDSNGEIIICPVNGTVLIDLDERNIIESENVTQSLIVFWAIDYYELLTGYQNDPDYNYSTWGPKDLHSDVPLARVEHRESELCPTLCKNVMCEVFRTYDGNIYHYEVVEGLMV